MDACPQLHGGYGYMREYPIARAWMTRATEVLCRAADHQGGCAVSSASPGRPARPGRERHRAGSRTRRGHLPHPVRTVEGS
ncbi:hypothetical protein [Pseudonocardia terrae]|uniref:hypothetical protein n=1 Tax=Pseudonocardia terrae TaxID=2905831 RepID=UPI0035571AB4